MEAELGIEVKHVSGVGLNSKFDVLRDGVKVAIIERNGNNGVRVLGPAYYQLGRFASIDAARSRIAEIEFLTAREVYERTCAEIHRKRKERLEQHFGPLMGWLSREWLSGSNSASVELGDLLQAIDTLAADREFTTCDPAAAGTHQQRTEYCFGGKAPFDAQYHYPSPPGEGKQFF